ncbi:hypothetical protein C8R44DRAFT_748587 [Mycena epipterygia]|nr:hypothetical protein C8R44DRAFT_748587 [Mycena epipterygia]
MLRVKIPRKVGLGKLIRKTSGSSRTIILQGPPTGVREENGGQDSFHFAQVLIAVNFARNFGLTDFARDFDPQHCAFAGSAEFPQWRKYEFGGMSLHYRPNEVRRKAA